ncbi:TolC family protein [Rubrivirga litoralis]|uniref:TolC family protein n=1 Tax=Rubrivirga litoralis TaxID=3075598 RepID=A0ABU3BLI7_9BACT|nr:TolC family protein [Rubrivirga sp. F394]MDT0630136.1 TolC family protein [Rubrivirga sp. F394]
MRRLLLLAVLTALAAPPAAAQFLAPDTVGTPLTLAEAIRLAVEQSPEVRRSELADRSLGSAVRAARAGRLPTLQARVTPQQSYGLAFDQTTGQVASQTVEQAGFSVFGQLPIYDGGRIGATIRQVELERDATAAGLERTRQEVALDVAQGFLQLLLDREIVEIQAEQLAAAEGQLARVAELVEAGARPRGDLIAQQSVVAERQTALVEARGAVALDRVTLVQAIGLDPAGAYRFVGPDAEALAVTGALAYAPRPAPALVAAAREGRSDRRAQLLRIQAAEAAVGVARASGRPSLALTGQVGTGYSSLQRQLTNPDAIQPTVPVTLADGTEVFVGGAPFTVPTGSPALEQTPFFDQFADNRSGSLELSLTVPIFDRFQTRRGVTEAQVAVEDARIALETLDRAVAADVLQSVVQAETAQARLAAARVQAEAAAAALRVERDRYLFGAGTLYDVAEAQARLAEAEGARAQAAYTLVFRVALVRLAVGDVDVAGLADQITGE